MQSILALITCALAVVSASSPPPAIKSTWGIQYAVFGAGNEQSYADALKNCHTLGDGWSLARIHGEREKKLLAKHIKEESYVGSWNGDGFEGRCLAIHPNAAVTLATKGCEGPLAYICEAPESVPTPAGY